MSGVGGGGCGSKRERERSAYGAGVLSYLVVVGVNRERIKLMAQVAVIGSKRKRESKTYDVRYSSNWFK